MNKWVTGVFATMLMAGWAHGLNRTWNDSTGSGLWTNAANWVENAVPGSADYAFFDNTKVGTSFLNTDLCNGT